MRSFIIDEHHLGLVMLAVNVVERWPRSRGLYKEQSSMEVQLGKRWVAVIDKVATHQGWPLRGVSLYS